MKQVFAVKRTSVAVGRTWLKAVVVAVASIGMLAGASQPAWSADAKPIVIGQSIPTLNNPWYAQFAQGSRDMAKALGVKLVLVTNPANAAFDPGAQINAIENLIAQRPAAIQIDPTSTSAIDGAIKEATAAHIPVVTDGIHVTAKVDAAVVADNKQGGELAGQYVALRLGSGGGDVAMLEGTPGRDIIAQRHAGFRAGLASNKGAKIVASQNANLDQAQGQTVTENILEAHPKLKAIWGASDTMALGAVEALKARNMTGRVLLGGFDGTPDAFRDIKAGTMDFTIDQVPYEMGATAIALAYKLAQGQKAPADTVLKTTLVDKSNVADYLDKSAAKNKAVLDALLKQYGLQGK
jgi:ribose transport system substrate-binding protein